MMNACAADSFPVGSDVVLLLGVTTNQETADPIRDQQGQLIQLPSTLAVEGGLMVEIKLDITARRFAATEPFTEIGQIIPASSEANAHGQTARSCPQQEIPGAIMRLAAIHDTADISEFRSRVELGCLKKQVVPFFGRRTHRPNS